MLLYTPGRGMRDYIDEGWVRARSAGLLFIRPFWNTCGRFSPATNPCPSAALARAGCGFLVCGTGRNLGTGHVCVSMAWHGPSEIPCLGPNAKPVGVTGWSSETPMPGDGTQLVTHT